MVLNFNKKVILLLVVVVVSFFLLNFFSKNDVGNSPLSFDGSPENLLIEINDSSSKVNIGQISDGFSEVIGSSQQYKVLLGSTAFEIMGSYNGNIFGISFFDEENTLLMDIDASLNPSDGVIEGYIAQRINDPLTKNISSFIFVDDDWKDAFPNTNVFWGSRYQFSSEFSFVEIQEGIYMMEIFDDPNRFSDGFSISVGGIVVGDVSVQNILEDNIVDKTFMFLYS